MASTPFTQHLRNSSITWNFSLRCWCTTFSCTSSGLEEEFFEVEEVLRRRLSKDGLCYDYKVRFKGYGPEDDMWLPASFFIQIQQPTLSHPPAPSRTHLYPSQASYAAVANMNPTGTTTRQAETMMQSLDINTVLELLRLYESTRHN